MHNWHALYACPAAENTLISPLPQSQLAAHDAVLIDVSCLLFVLHADLCACLSIFALSTYLYSSHTLCIALSSVIIKTIQIMLNVEP